MEDSVFAAVEEQVANEAALQNDPREAYLNYAVEKLVAMKNDHNLDLDEADTRFSTVLPLRTVRNMSVAIVGAGGLGNWQWRVLLGMGFRRLAIFDDDTVGIENIGPQAHSLLDLGMPKVEAVRQAALLYRGIDIQAINQRVSSLRDINNILHYMPDIIITCTDSAEFRKGFFESFTRKSMDVTLFYGDGELPHMLPKLWLDYRMSLGDWTCYALPLKYMLTHMRLSQTRAFLSQYAEEAIFEPEAAVQEPCTARAIVYTGANVASYTGAYLHWFISRFMRMVNGDDEEITPADALSEYAKGNLDMQPKMTFSARDWEFITESKAEKSLRRKLIDARAKIAELEDRIEELGNLRDAVEAHMEAAQPQVEEQQEEHHEYDVIHWNDLQVGQVVNFPALDEDGETCEILELHDNYALVQYASGRPTRVNIRFASEVRLFHAGTDTSV